MFATRLFRSTLALGLFLATCLVFTSAYRTLAFAGGTGTVADPFQIASCADLISIDDVAANLSKSFVLTQNINCSSTTIVPMKNGSTFFTGVLDGGNYAIAGLSISCSATDCGLFAATGTNAKIQNLTFTAPTVSSSSINVGLIAGRSGLTNTVSHITINGGSISTSYASATRSDPSYVGGIFGQGSSGTISNITSSATVSGGNYVGGIAGNAATATLLINDVNINGNITGESWVGGVLGSFYNAASYGLVVTRAAIGAISVSGWQEVGGFLGYGWNVKVDSSSSLATVSGRGVAVNSSGIGDGAMVGGYVGQLSGGDSMFVDTWVRGNVSATYLDFNAVRVGGIVGWARLTNLYVTRSSFAGTVTGYQYVAGVSGMQSLYSYVTDSYFRADLVSSTTTLNGGMVGNTSYTSSFTRSYYVGTQNVAVASRRGIVGATSVGATTCTNTFFDSDVLGSTSTSQSSNVCTGVARTTAQMTTQSTFTGYDFTPGTGVWSIDPNINNGYPFLAAVGAPSSDVTPPTATWTAPASPSSSRTLSYTLTFSEAVSGIASGDFSNTGTSTGCVFSPSAASASTSITVSVTCSSDGTVIARLAANSVLDGSSNTGPSAAEVATSVNIDTSPATTSSSSSSTTSTTVSSSSSSTTVVSGSSSSTTSTTLASSSTTVSAGAPTTTVVSGGTSNTQTTVATGSSNSSSTSVANRPTTTSVVESGGATVAPTTTIAPVVNTLAPIDVPNTPVGGASAIVNGQTVTASITRVNNELNVKVGPIAARIWAKASDGAKVPLDADGRLRLMPGDSAVVEVEGFSANSMIEVRLYSDPVLLGRTKVSSTGTVGASYEIPKEVEVGNHHIVMNGDSQSGEVTFSLSVAIGKAPAGLNAGLIAIPLTLAILGALLLPVALRRRRNHKAQNIV